MFNSKTPTNIHSYINKRCDPLLALADANWGAQDQSHSPKPKQIELFESRSMSDHLVYFYGPIQWQSKRQTITARSSAEAEIYANDECVRELTYIKKLFKDLDLEKTFIKGPTKVFNDNSACFQWTKNRTTRSIRHIQLRDNAVREEFRKKKIDVIHIKGENNIAYIFTKEDKHLRTTIYPQKEFYEHFTSARLRILD